MGLRKRTDSYWSRRSAERLTLAEQEMEPYQQQVLKAYEDAKREVLRDLRRMYAAYYKDDDTFNMIALNSIAPEGDIRRFRDEMKRRGLNTKLPDNYNGRVTRLELIEAQLQAKVDQIGLKQNQIEGKAHRNTIESSYYHSIYDVSKGIGVTPAFAQLNEKTINKILETKFEGKNYSERIWGNANVLAQQLREKLAKAVATGQSVEKTAREFRERFGVGESYAKRLIRTETNYFENTAEIEAYEAMGIEYFVFVATLDARTSEICQSMDGQKFKVKDAVAGENYPPLHPNCVLPDTMIVAPDLYGVTRSEYSGDIFKFFTSDGRTLSVTANHVMLTSRGFVRAKFIDKGDYIIGYGNWGEVAEGSPANNDSPATAEQLFTSFRETSGMTATCVPASAKYLKGDVVPDSDVDVVLVDSFFKHEGDISSPELIGDCESIATNMRCGSLFTNGSMAQILMATALASDCIMCGKSITGVLGNTSIPHHNLIRLLNASLYDSRLVKSSVDDRSGDTKFFSELTTTLAEIVFSDNGLSVQINPSATKTNTGSPESSSDGAPVAAKSSCDPRERLPSFVHPNEVVDIKKEFYSGHVYDFASLSTLYLANGLVSSNCRSTIRAYIDKNYEPETRIYRDPETGKNGYTYNMSYDEWKQTFVDNYALFGKELGTMSPAEWVKFLSKKATNELAGVRRGKPMTFEEADSGKVNPEFDWDSQVGSNINCQASVVAFEARMRGFDVEAKLNNASNPLVNQLASSFWDAWINKNGSPVYLTDYLLRANVENQKSGAIGFWQRLNSVVVPNGRYSMDFLWNDRTSAGHVMVVLVDSKKNISFYDPQVNRMFSTPKEINSLMRNIRWNRTVGGQKIPIQPKILRLDDKEMSYNMVSGVVRKARK